MTKICSARLLCKKNISSLAIIKYFIKSTNHQPPTNRPPTTYPATNLTVKTKFTDPPTRFYFLDLILKKYSLHEIHTQLGNISTFALIT